MPPANGYGIPGVPHKRRGQSTCRTPRIPAFRAVRLLRFQVVGQFVVQPSRLQVQAGRQHHKLGKLTHYPFSKALIPVCGRSTLMIEE
jgi:hypothetical protein